MLGLGNSVSSSSAIEQGEVSFTLPVDGNYIYLFDEFAIDNTAITGDDGVPPSRDCEVISSNEIVFDDTEYELFSMPVTNSGIYLDQSDYTNGNNMSPTLGAGDSITISGKITEADTTNTYVPNNNDAQLYFVLGNSADTTKVFVKYLSTPRTLGSQEAEVNSTGVFTRTFTLADTPNRFRIQSGLVGIKAASGDPGVRISNLSIVKN